VILPGGFSYGDYLRSGAIARFSPIMRAVTAHAQDGGPVLASATGSKSCARRAYCRGPDAQRALKFLSRPVRVRVESIDTPFTRLYRAGEELTVPIAHGRRPLRLARARRTSSRPADRWSGVTSAPTPTARRTTSRCVQRRPQCSGDHAAPGAPYHSGTGRPGWSPCLSFHGGSSCDAARWRCARSWQSALSGVSRSTNQGFRPGGARSPPGPHAGDANGDAAAGHDQAAGARSGEGSGSREADHRREEPRARGRRTDTTSSAPPGRRGGQAEPFPGVPRGVKDVPYDSPDTGTVSPGMSERQVYSLWGRPAAVRREGEYTYLFFRTAASAPADLGPGHAAERSSGRRRRALAGHNYSGESSSRRARKHGPHLPGDPLRVHSS